VRGRGRIVFVEDDESFRTVISRELVRDGYKVQEVGDGKAVAAALKELNPHMVLLDLKLPEQNGLEILKRIRAYDPDIQVVMLTGHGGVEEAVEAMRMGAYDFLTKPVRLDVLEQVVARAVERHGLLQENCRLRRIAENQNPEAQLLGESAAVGAVRELIRRIAPAEGNVLILGENGTGKELAARNLHLRSKRAAGPVLTVNCAAIPENLVESELFGHERGAFTGADRRRAGVFEAADGGTLFLDEIGELPLAIQPALLRAVQSGEIKSIGSERTRNVDVRVVAATNRDLLEEVRAGRFREDLYYRLSALEIDIPPLRERREDIALLARYFLANSADSEKRNLVLEEDAVQRLMVHDWPGNVRELENAMTRLSVLATDERVTAATIDQLVLNRIRPGRGVTLPDLCLEDLEKAAILAALTRLNGNKKEAARQLGVSLKTLYNKLSKYGLREQFVQR